MSQATRDGFGIGLAEIGDNEDIVVLTADLAESTRVHTFAEKYPNRFFEVGVSEQNLMGMAAGMAHVGKIPFASSFASFHPGRNWDQLRVSVCYSKHNVKIIGSHAGLTVGEDGATHQALEDIAITRVLPNLTVIVPCDAEEARKATHALAKHKGPVYLRLGRANIPNVTTEKSPFTIGKANILQEGTDVTIIACGIMVHSALQAAEKLKKKKISAQIINLHTITPIDKKTIIAAAKKTGAIVTAEEHQIDGGLGSAVAEVLAEEIPTPLERVGIQSTFGESGPAEALLKKYGLTDKEIVAATAKVLTRKKARQKI